METKGGSERLERIARRLGFDKWVVVEAQGNAGGLAMFWFGELDMVCL